MRGLGRGGFEEGLRRRAGTGVWEAAGKKWTEDMAEWVSKNDEAVAL